MNELLELMLNADQLIGEIVSQYGKVTYFIIFAIIFIETGLVVVTFFPGDALLFSTGILAASGEISLGWILVLLILATVLGNTSNFMIGRYIGEKFFRKERINRSKYLAKAFGYYERNHFKANVLSRFFPFLRSFVPFVSGVSEMKFSLFTSANITGGVIWIGTYVLIGYFFGSIPWVEENYGLVFSLSIIFMISIMVLGGIRLLFYRFIFKKNNHLLK